MKQRNAVQCRHCGTEIESKHRHDFVSHECTAADGRRVFIAVDGGSSYLKRVGYPADMIELSVPDAGKPEALTDER